MPRRVYSDYIAVSLPFGALAYTGRCRSARDEVSAASIAARQSQLRKEAAPPSAAALCFVLFGVGEDGSRQPAELAWAELHTLVHPPSRDALDVLSQWQQVRDLSLRHGLGRAAPKPVRVGLGAGCAGILLTPRYGASAGSTGDGMRADIRSKRRCRVGMAHVRCVAYVCGVVGHRGGRAEQGQRGRGARRAISMDQRERSGWRSAGEFSGIPPHALAGDALTCAVGQP